MPEFKFSQIFNNVQFQKLIDEHFSSISFPISLYDNNGSIIYSNSIKTKCLPSYRINPNRVEDCCKLNDLFPINFDGHNCFLYKCKGGLLDIGIPVMFEGCQLATIYLGQFLYDDVSFINDSNERLQDRCFNQYDTCFKTIKETSVFTSKTVKAVVANSLELIKNVTCIIEENCNKPDNSNKVSDFTLPKTKSTIESIKEITKDGKHVNPSDLIFDVSSKFLDDIANKGNNLNYKKNGSMFKSVYDKGEALNIVLDYDLRIKDINNELLQLLGYSKDELIGKKVSELVQPNLRDTFTTELEKNFLGINISYFDVSFKSKKGYDVTILFSPGQVPLYDGEVLTGLLITGIDITAIEHDGTVPIYNNSNFTTLAECLPDVVARFDRELRYTYLNPAAQSIFGIPPNDFIGRTNEEMWIPKSLADLWNWNLMKAFKTGDTCFMEFDFPSPTGTLNIKSRAVPEFSSDGKILSVLFIASDVTEAKFKEATLHEIEAKYTNLVKHSSDGIIIADENGKILEWNHSLELISGWKKEEVLGKSLNDIQFKVIPQIFLKDNATEKTDSQNRSRNLKSNKELLNNWHEQIQINKQGEEKILHTIIFTNKFDEGEVLVSFIRDYTSRKKIETELIKAKEEAEHANRAKSEFLAMMSHEIRTPMNGIIGMTELALTTNLTDEQKEYLDAVNNSADSLLNIINEILDFSKIEAGKLEIEDIEFNLRDLVEKTVNIVAIKAFEKGLEMLFNIDKEVPENVIGDPYRLRQIIINLLVNAIKFTEKGEISLFINKKNTINSAVEIEFSVVDTGIGIENNKLDKLFKEFSQVDNSITRKYGGTGLGLAISKELANLMGGDIKVTSAPDVGSTFVLTVMLKVGREPILMVQKPFDSDKVLKVLIIDDNSTNRSILTGLLNQWDCSVDSVSNGIEALMIIKQLISKGKNYDFILLDIDMPQLDGIYLVRQIRSELQLSELPIIMLISPVGLSINIKRLKSFDIENYIIKPVRPSDLYSVIYKLFHPIKPKQAKLEFGDSYLAKDAFEMDTKFTILLAEDNLINRQLTVAMLNKKGFKVITAENGFEAIDKLKANKVDIILMDIIMPEMDGYTATRKIREIEKPQGIHIPIIALTAHAMKGFREKCLAAGMDDHISKPIKMNDLFSIIKNHIVQPVETNHQSGILLPVRLKEDTEVSVPLPLDFERLMKRVEGDSELIEIIVQYFVENYPLFIKEIKELIRDNKFTDASRKAHTLNGMLLNLEITSPRDELAYLENNVINMKKEDALLFVEKISAGLDRTRDYIETTFKKF